MIPQGPITRATVRTSAVLAIKFVAQAGIVLLLAYLLGPAHFGAFAAITSLAVLHGALATFGTHSTLLRDLSRDFGMRDRILPTVLGTTAVCGTLLLLIYLPITFFLFHEAGVGTLVIMCLGLSEILFHPFLLLSATQRHAAGQIANSQLLMTAPLILRMAVLASIWMVDASDPLLVYAIGHLLASILALVLSLSVLDQPWPSPRSWRIPTPLDLRNSSGFALMMLTANGPSEIDKILAVRMLPLSTAGLYAAASRVIGASAIPVLSLMISALPRLFLQTDDKRPHLLKWLFIATLLYGTTASATLYLLASPIEWAFGSRFSGVGDNIRLLVLAVLPMSLRIAATNTLMTSGNPWLRVGTEATGIALLLILALGLIPSLSTTGLIIAVTITESIMAVTAWTWIFRSRHAPPSTPSVDPNPR